MSQEDGVGIEVGSTSASTLHQNATGVPEPQPPPPTPAADREVHIPVPDAIGPVRGNGIRPEVIEALSLSGVQVVDTVLSQLAKGSNTLSNNEKIVRFLAVGSNIFGYIALLGYISMCRRDRRLANRILRVSTCAGAAFSFIASMSLLLPDDVMLWVTFLCCTACLPALAAALRG